MDYIIGMDIGTTASKGALYQENGKKIAESTIPYPLIQEKVDQAEEDPQVIFDAVQKIIFDLSKKASGKVKAISWSSQMHSLIGLGKNNQLLTNSITWADNRSREVVTAAKKSGLANSIYQRTGMPPHPMAPVYKLLWIKEKKPELFAQMQKWIGIKEYIIWRLTGKMMTDTTMAAGTGLLNLNNLSWDEDLLSQITLEKEKLPILDKPETVVGGIIPNYIQKLGLNDQTQIILGASDGYLSTIGVGVLNDKSFALNVGTSGAVRVIAPKAIVDSENRFFCYPVDKKHYLLGGPVNNGGIVFEWARKTIFGPDQTAEDFINVAESVPAGSNGLIFHPYLGGERAPIWNAQARGSFIGLTRNHTKPQMARSVLEGIVFNLLGAARGLREKIGEPEALRVTGGFVKSDFVRQLIADIFNLPVIIIKNDQSGTLAAMFLAQVGMKREANLEKIAKKIDESKVYFPNPKNVAVYQDIIPIYREVEHDLDQSYEKIASFQEKYPRLFE
ncbi:MULTISPECIES: gluconokinase [Lactobacillus]|uniref:Gluconokinase n=1 Tax=Lactobacillus gasseri TaxID=1596 RepID=A0A8A4UWI5_LACGS|nr:MULTISPECIES: gluconokinase [Lactobacillus]MBW8451831.1 gluconokinase [Lactobacillus paragasseri]MYM17220.1 gluconate kinase [Lactobacillus gasseri]QTD66070.1 gluconokinase [Lactobacillus gasseri]